MRMTGVPIVDALLVTASVLIALGVIWRMVLRPLVHAARQAEETLPVVLDIAKEFKADSGSSLRDLLDTLGQDAKELSKYAHGFKHDFVGRFAALAGNQELMQERLDELSGAVTSMRSEVDDIRQIVDRRESPR